MNLAALNKRLAEIANFKNSLKQQIVNEINYLNNNGIEHNIQFDSINTPLPQINTNEYMKIRENVTDKTFIEKMKPNFKYIDSSNGSRYFNKMKVNIGIIADEFLYKSFVDAANFYYLKRNNYKDIEANLDVVIIASAWKGIENDWRGMANPESNTRKDLLDLIYYYKKKKVKVIFYSKEDPTNYEKFLGIAKECDVIFTTAIEKIPDYQNECKHINVYPLEFGVNPIYNNPINMNNDNKKNGALFAGSWYEKYPHRIKDTRAIFDGVINSDNDLKIIDRNFELNLPNHYFPQMYLPYVSPSIKHEDLQKLFKFYDWIINLNSVKSSETMFANRVYELQAMGNAILSNYSLGMNNKFPNIFMVHDKAEVADIMNRITGLELYEQQLLGLRKVLKEHTTFHRINTLLEITGLNKFQLPKKKIGIVVNRMSEQNKKNIERQSLKVDGIFTIENLKEKYDEIDFVAFFHDNYFYEEYYLEDMINGFKYTNATYITKSSYYLNGEMKNGIEHEFINYLEDKYLSVFASERFDINDLTKLEGDLELPNGYAIDGLEVSKGKILKHFDEIIEDNEYKLSIIIPVYNNGDHLYSKCFMSLRRSSIFKQLDIILVDDGSTEEHTKRIINRLNRKYDNIQVYKFEDNGSGSASRPRNKGVELAKTNYITYLDPDNEAVNDGYARLLEEMHKDNDIDMVVGDIVKFDTKETVLNYSKNIFKWNPIGEVETPYEFLKESKMRAQSIQALIVKKNIIQDNQLKMIEQAAGQDTLFFQELLLNSKKIKALDLIIHVYYAAVSNSVTNTISKNFFNKYLILEKERYIFLKKHALLDCYMEDRFDQYFIGWYLSRVPRIKEDEWKSALEVLTEIYTIYQPHLKNNNRVIKDMDKLFKKRKYKEIVNYCKEYFSK